MAGTEPAARTSRGVHRLAVVTTGATLLLIAMGGAVRATDSGLACPDWPACYGMWIPPADLHMWLEHSHRLWAGAVGLAVLALVIMTWRNRRTDRWSWRASVLTGVLILVQAGLGAAVVLLHLRAGLVTSHLGMSLIVVAALIAIAIRTGQPATPSVPADAATTQRFRTMATTVAALVFGQALLGGQATGRGAAYVFDSVPIWLTSDPWTGHIREVLHVTHRAGGYVVAAAVIALAVASRKPGLPHYAQPLANTALVLVIVQVGLGLANVLTNATVWSAIGHLAVASWLWTALFVLVGCLYRDRVTPSAPDAKTTREGITV